MHVYASYNNLPKPEHRGAGRAGFQQPVTYEYYMRIRIKEQESGRSSHASACISIAYSTYIFMLVSCVSLSTVHSVHTELEARVLVDVQARGNTLSPFTPSGSSPPGPEDPQGTRGKIYVCARGQKSG